MKFFPNGVLIFYQHTSKLFFHLRENEPEVQALYLFVQSYQILCECCCCPPQKSCAVGILILKEQKMGSIFTDSQWYIFPVKSLNTQTPYVWKVPFLSFKCHKSNRNVILKMGT